MKLMVASDLHGSAYFTELLLAAYKRERANKLLLLGDLLYHGPRNALPNGYAPAQTAELLNGVKNELLCVRGNCDSDVDQMVLNFPIMAEYCWVYLDGLTIFATHGHVFNEQSTPMLKKGDILLQGHTHVPICHVHDMYTCMNPGSVSIPKDNSANGYMTIENGRFLWKKLDGEVYREVSAEELI